MLHASSSCSEDSSSTNVHLQDSRDALCVPSFTLSLSRFHLEYLASLLVHVAAKYSFGIRGLGVWWLKGTGL